MLQSADEGLQHFTCATWLSSRSNHTRCGLTGHSLGGALATLAAYDIAALWPTMAVSCYTFGAPRTGNRAFAVDYARMVQDTWHVINGGCFKFIVRCWRS